MANADYYIETYNSFAGVDIKAIFDEVVIGTLQAISWAITREKAPVYTMGSPTPRAFNRGKRGIAGGLTFITFDRDALITAMKNKYFLDDVDAHRVYQNYDSMMGTRLPFEQIDLLDRPAAATDYRTTGGPVDWDQVIREPYYADQIPPFHITLAAANEYGALSVMRIFGVEIINQGGGVSIDDLVLEQQYQFVARDLTPWIQQRRIDIKRGYSRATTNTHTVLT